MMFKMKQCKLATCSQWAPVVPPISVILWHSVVLVIPNSQMHKRQMHHAQSTKLPKRQMERCVQNGEALISLRICLIYDKMFSVWKIYLYERIKYTSYNVWIRIVENTKSFCNDVPTVSFIVHDNVTITMHVKFWTSQYYIMYLHISGNRTTHQ